MASNWSNPEPAEGKYRDNEQTQGDGARADCCGSEQRANAAHDTESYRRSAATPSECKVEFCFGNKRKRDEKYKEPDIAPPQRKEKHDAEDQTGKRPSAKIAEPCGIWSPLAGPSLPTQASSDTHRAGHFDLLVVQGVGSRSAALGFRSAQKRIERCRGIVTSSTTTVGRRVASIDKYGMK
jgi:hypothetical protein